MAPKRSVQRGNIKLISGIVVAGVLVIGGAVFLGMSDKGQIDISAAIANSNATAREEGRETVADPRPINASDPSLPNGGLVGTGKPDKPVPPPPAEVEGEATTTDSETGEVTEEDVAEAAEAEENQDTEEVQGEETASKEQESQLEETQGE